MGFCFPSLSASPAVGYWLFHQTYSLTTLERRYFWSTSVTLHIKKVKPREGKWFAQGHTVKQCQCHNKKNSWSIAVPSTPCCTLLLFFQKNSEASIMTQGKNSPAWNLESNWHEFESYPHHRSTAICWTSYLISLSLNLETWTKVKRVKRKLSQVILYLLSSQ